LDRSPAFLRSQTQGLALLGRRGVPKMDSV
jgi:hypothetical protein